MSTTALTDMLAQARHNRSARRAVRAEHAALVEELSAFTTPAGRLEIELLAQHSSDPNVEAVLEILNALPTNSHARTAA